MDAANLAKQFQRIGCIDPTEFTKEGLVKLQGFSEKEIQCYDTYPASEKEIFAEYQDKAVQANVHHILSNTFFKQEEWTKVKSI